MPPASDRLSAFGALLSEICERQDISLYAAGQRIGLTSRASMSYIVRPHQGTSRRGVLTTRQIRMLARAIRATREEETRLVILGCLEHAPSVLAQYVAYLEEELESLRKKDGKPTVHFHIIES